MIIIAVKNSFNYDVVYENGEINLRKHQVWMNMV